MDKAKLTSRGQITIPKAVRERLGLQPGDELEFVADKEVLCIRKCAPNSPFAPYRGYLKNLAGHDPGRIVEDSRGR